MQTYGKHGCAYYELAPLPTFESLTGNVWGGAAKEMFPDPAHFQRPYFTPCYMYNLCTLETSKVSPELFKIGLRTVEWGLKGNSPTSRLYAHEMSVMSRVFANMGKSEEMADVLIAQINCVNADLEYCYYTDNGYAPVFENRLTSREGINAMSAQRLGNVAAGIQLALLQSDGGLPTGSPVLRLFPALPKGWNANYRLHARGGFVVEASCVGGVIKVRL